MFDAILARETPGAVCSAPEVLRLREGQPVTLLRRYSPTPHGVDPDGPYILAAGERVHVDYPCPFPLPGREVFIKEIWASAEWANHVGYSSVLHFELPVWFAAGPDIERHMLKKGKAPDTLYDRDFIRGAWRPAATMLPEFSRLTCKVMKREVRPVSSLAAEEGLTEKSRQEWQDVPGHGLFSVDWAWFVTLQAEEVRA